MLTCSAIALFVARVTREVVAVRERAERLASLVPTFADTLRALGATRVVLFGSLARGDAPHARTDVDLAVWGLGEGELFAAMEDFARTMDASVDLVRGEAMGPRLAAAVAQDGVEVGRGTRCDRAGLAARHSYEAEPELPRLEVLAARAGRVAAELQGSVGVVIAELEANQA